MASPYTTPLLPQTKKVKYLNNRDLLLEIHRSKCTFSSFTKPEYQQYDIIVNNLADIDTAIVEQAKTNRAKRQGLEMYNRLREQGDRKIKLTECIEAVGTISINDIVIRLMTYDHIPKAPGRKKTAKTTADVHEKVNFPPFQHWKYDDDQKLVCVGKSHWKGCLIKGSFSKDHGRVTENLGRMYIKLAERFAQRSNWRGYCVDTETEALTQRGWLRYDQINEDDIILSYNGFNLSWSPIHEIYRGEYNGLLHSIQHTKINALVTPNHKMVTNRGLVKVEYLTDRDNLMIMASAEKGPVKSKYGRPEDVSRLSFEILNSDFTPENIQQYYYNLLDFNLWQRRSLTNRLSNYRKVFKTSDKNKADWFQSLATLAGYKTNSRQLKNGTYVVDIYSAVRKTVAVKHLDFNGGDKFSDYNHPTVPYNGTVWCPKTNYGCFVARRHGNVHLTGNTYIEEMKGQAILQLSQIGLQFDESKSDNPFSYFTSATVNSFTRILNLEKKCQNIRDDLLEENGLAPSMTRQYSQEYAKEIARQAEIYKNIRLPKSQESDYVDDTSGEDTIDLVTEEVDLSSTSAEINSTLFEEDSGESNI